MTVTRSRFTDGTDLLLQLGWEKTGEGDLGETWSKGSGQTQIAYRTEGAEWWRFITGLAYAESVTPAALESQLARIEPLRKPRPAQRTELDLHLAGPTIRKSEGDAKSFGQFVSAVATAIKEIIKSDLGLGRHEDRLVVQGVQPGSLRVRFMEPEQPPFDDLLVDSPDSTTPEGGALWRLGQIFNVAEEAAASPADSPDLTSATAMTVAARSSLNKLSSLVERAHWSAHGYLRGAQSDNTESVSLSLSAAFRLAQSTKEEELRIDRQRLVGTVDGFHWSDGMMRFVSGDAAPFRAAVPVGLQEAVVELLQDPTRPTAATFNVTTRRTPDGRIAATSYILVDIEGTQSLLS